MTVCIAAIGQGSIFAASDRMVTSGDIEFEPEQPKIWQLTNAIAMMTAGDIAVQTEIFASLSAELDVSLNGRIAEDLINFETPAVEAIITGIDHVGPHIFVVKNGQITCQDRIGFAAIGIGAGHAESQFMFQRHTRDNSGQETMFLTYSAKKRAEVAPGVGQDTDMVIVGPQLGAYFPIVPEVINKLEEIYQDARKGHDAADLAANRAMNAYVEEIAKSAQPTTDQEQAVAAVPSDSEARDGTGDAAQNKEPKKES